LTAQHDVICNFTQLGMFSINQHLADIWFSDLKLEHITTFLKGTK